MLKESNKLRDVCFTIMAVICSFIIPFIGVTLGMLQWINWIIASIIIFGGLFTANVLMFMINRDYEDL